MFVFLFIYRELSFKKGDIIYIRREIDKNWFEGEHNAMVGLLPSNYIEVGGGGCCCSAENGKYIFIHF